MSKITYANKVALNVNPNIADINKVNDTDMNMIKDVVNANETKILLAVSDTAPAECSLGDMYFDTTDNLIYTATATDTWSSTGEAPTENTIYVVMDTQTSYIYDGTTLISVGGGSGGIVVAPDTPTEDTILYIESTDLDGQFSNSTLVWTNPSPNNDFAGQTIELALAGYDLIDIVSTSGVYRCTPTGYYINMIRMQDSNGNYSGSWFIDMRPVQVNQTEIVFNDNRGATTNSTNSYSVRNNHNKPLYIIGYKL